MSPVTDKGAPVTTDTLLLGSAVSVPHGSLVAELGCGSGAVIRRASRLNPGCTWLGIDKRWEPLASLTRSADRMTGAVSVLAVCCSVSRATSIFPSGFADCVICNPPYGISGRVRLSPLRERALSRSGDDLLGIRFVRAASQMLRTGGSFLMINLPSALTWMLLGCETWGLNPVELQPVGPAGRPAVRILLRAVKGGGEDLMIRTQSTCDELLSSCPEDQGIAFEL